MTEPFPILHPYGIVHAPGNPDADLYRFAINEGIAADSYYDDTEWHLDPDHPETKPGRPVEVMTRTYWRQQLAPTPYVADPQTQVWATDPQDPTLPERWLPK